MIGQETIPTTFERFLTREFRQLRGQEKVSLPHHIEAALIVARTTAAMMGREIRGPAVEDFVMYDVPPVLTEDSIYGKAAHFFTQSGFEIEGRSALGVLWMKKGDKKYTVNISLYNYANPNINGLIVTVKDHGHI